MRPWAIGIAVQGFLVLCLCAQPVYGQSAEPTSPQLKTRAASGQDADIRSVILDVIARNRAGDPMTNLTEQDFSVVDDKKRIDSRAVKLSGRPSDRRNTQVTLVIDAMNSSLPDLAKSEDAVEAFLRSQLGRLESPTSILIVSDSAPQSASSKGGASAASNTTVRPRQLFIHRIPPSVDAALLIKGLKDYGAAEHRILDAQGGLGEGERVGLSLQALSSIGDALSSEPGAKLVVWIGPGWPMVLRSEAKSSEQLFDSVVYFSNLLRKARIILYSIDPAGVASQDSTAETEAFLLASRPGAIRAAGHAPGMPNNVGDSYYGQFVKGVKNSKEANANDLSLQVLAYQSGGLVLQHNNDLKTQIAECAADQDALYSLAYTPVAGTGLDVYHELKVVLSKDSEPLRTRTGIYWK